MENLKNSVRLSGFAATDPVIINLENNKKMARLSIGVHEYYKGSTGDWINKTLWFNLVFWNKKVELVEEIVKKGTGFSIEGRLSSQSYVDKKGESRFSTEVIVNTLQLTSQTDG
jgi:single-strand DNA-binding protein